MKPNTNSPLFPIGRLLLSSRVNDHGIDLITPYVTLHQEGDWGQVDQETKCANDQELQKPKARQTHLQSRYMLLNGQEIRISTNLQLGLTCVLLADE